jgi:ABC-type multidrug transport system ATPase subunit/uncharacterized tellurite resistance protein B-like protein/FtsH-binding integral membrane protein
MPSGLRAVLDAANPRLRGDGLEDAAAAAVITAFALIALSDEVSTLSERRALAAILSDQWAIDVAPESVCQILETAAAEPRHLLLHNLEAQFRTWPRDRAQRLMAGLTEIIGADGHVAWAEQALLGRLGVLLGLERSAPPAAPRRGSMVLSTVSISEGESLRVGRSLRAEICLPRAPIAPIQIRLTARGGRIEFEDVGETVAAVAGGRATAAGVLAVGEELSIGRYRLRLESERYELSIVHPGFSTVLKADDVATVVRQEGRFRALLDGVTFSASAGEMVAIIGPSGSGKSTLLHLLRGEVPASRGQATLDGVPIQPGAAMAIRRISFVPQEELLLAALTVEESVSFTARLKGLHGADHPGMAGGALIEEMLERVGLSNRDVRRTAIGDTVRRGISGGQRRRVSVAQELVGDDTDVLLLDEPTSGLDPRSEAGITELMRDLADSGKIVIVATHAVQAESLRDFDSVLCLDSAGRPAYFGPPSKIAAHFQVRSVAEIFERLDVAEVPEARGQAPSAGFAERRTVRRARGGSSALGLFGQISVLLRREATVRMRDPVSLALAAALPIAVAGLCSLVYYRGCVHPILLFVLCLASLWSGVSFTVRDITSQFALLRHESRTRALLEAAYAAKAIVATAASAVQALLLTAAVFWVFGARSAGSYRRWPELLEQVSLMSPVMALLVLWACHVLGNAVGALLSACFRTAESAIFMIPFVLLPMVALSGALVPPTELPSRLIQAINFNPLYQGYVGMLGSSASICSTIPVDLENPARTDRSVLCGAEARTKRPPPAAGLAPFVQSEGSCLHNTFLRSGEFCRMEGLPSLPPAEGVAAQMNSRLVGRSLAILLGFAALLHLAAVRICGRRMRTL